MSEWLVYSLLAFATVCLVGGASLESHATRKYGNESLPRYPTLNPKHWRPVWRLRNQFSSDRGFDLFMWGDALITWGAAAAVVFGFCEYLGR